SDHRRSHWLSRQGATSVSASAEYGSEEVLRSGGCSAWLQNGRSQTLRSPSSCTTSAKRTEFDFPGGAPAVDKATDQKRTRRSPSESPRPSGRSGCAFEQ